MDITKCSNNECKVKDNCLRYLAQDTEKWQSYASFECNKENNWENKLRVNKINKVINPPKPTLSGEDVTARVQKMFKEFMERFD